MNGEGFMAKWALFIYGYELNADAVQALTGFEGRKIAMMRSAYEQKQRRSDMEAAAEPMRRQEQAPPSPTANVNFPGPDPSPSSNK